MLSTSSDACANHAMVTNNSISPGESRRADAATGWLGRIVGGGGRFNIFKKWIKCRDPTAVCNPPFPDEQTYHAGFFPAPRLASAMTTEFSALQTPTPPTHEPSNSSIGRKRAIELINSSSPSISIWQTNLFIKPFGNIQARFSIISIKLIFIKFWKFKTNCKTNFKKIKKFF